MASAMDSDIQISRYQIKIKWYGFASQLCGFLAFTAGLFAPRLVAYLSVWSWRLFDSWLGTHSLLLPYVTQLRVQHLAGVQSLCVGFYFLQLASSTLRCGFSMSSTSTCRPQVVVCSSVIWSSRYFVVVSLYVCNQHRSCCPHMAGNTYIHVTVCPTSLCVCVNLLFVFAGLAPTCAIVCRPCSTLLLLM